VAIDADGSSAPDRGTYSVNLETSRFYVRVTKSTRLGHSHAARGSLLSGEISLDEAAAGGELEFDMESLLADEPEARRFVRLKGTISESDQQKVTETMLGPKVVDATRFPTAKFTIRKVVSAETPRGQYTITGDFTLHGVTRSVDIKAVAKPGDKDDTDLRLRGYFKIKQTDFEIQPYRAASGLVGVFDTLTIWGGLRLLRER